MTKETEQVMQELNQLEKACQTKREELEALVFQEEQTKCLGRYFAARSPLFEYAHVTSVQKGCCFFQSVFFQITPLWRGDTHFEYHPAKELDPRWLQEAKEITKAEFDKAFRKFQKEMTT